MPYGPWKGHLYSVLSLHLGNWSEKCLLFKCSFGFRSAWMKQIWGAPSPSSSTVLQVSHHYSKVILYTLSVSQFSCSVVSYSSRPHGLQHARHPCPSPTPGVYPNSCPLRRRQWQPTPVLLPGRSHGWRGLVGCSPWGR